MALNCSLRPPLAELLPATICTCLSSYSNRWCYSFILLSRVINLSNATSMSFFLLPNFKVYYFLSPGFVNFSSSLSLINKMSKLKFII